jgi:hypothetical protein
MPHHMQVCSGSSDKDSFSDLPVTISSSIFRLMTDRKANIQAGFSAGWSAKPEKTVPIAKSILEIRQALNVSHYLFWLYISRRTREEKEHEERRKERQREIMVEQE